MRRGAESDSLGRPLPRLLPRTKQRGPPHTVTAGSVGVSEIILWVAETASHALPYCARHPDSRWPLPEHRRAQTFSAGFDPILDRE